MAAADCGLSETEMHSQFPAGITDAISAYGAYADKNMITAFHGQDAQTSLPCLFIENPLPYLDLARTGQTSQGGCAPDIGYLARPQHAKLAASAFIQNS